MRRCQHVIHHWTLQIVDDSRVRAVSMLLFILLCGWPSGAQAATETDSRESLEDTRYVDETIAWSADESGKYEFERTGELDVNELRSLATDDAWVLDFERSTALEQLYANPDLNDRTVDIFAQQLEYGLPAFPSGTQDDISGAKQEFGLYDPNDEPAISEKGDAKILPLFNLESIYSTHSITGSYISADCTSPGPCVFPAAYDAKAERVYLVWRVSSYAYAAMQDHVYQQNGKSLRLILQGLQLNQGPGVANPEDFHAYVSASGCGTTYASPCLVTVVERDAWFPATGPWTPWDVRVELWDTQQLSVPILEIDQWGNLTPIYSVPVKLAERVDAVIPSPNLQSFWSNTIGITLLSDRCTTCHTMDTPGKIDFRHGGIINGSAIPIPSLLVPNESVLHCGNCHEQQLSYLGPSSRFPEPIWATPTPQLDINWAQIMNDYPMTWQTEICNRMVTTLPTHALREQHFHEDARLFWAVAKGELPLGYPSLPTASPSSYTQFIDRFDTWNDSNAPCP